MLLRRMPPLVLAAALLGGGLPAAAAAAQTPSPSAQTPGLSAQTPAPVRAHIRLYLPDVFWVQHGPVTVPGRVVHVGGVVRPYVAGQSVLLKAYLGRRLFRSVRLELRRSRDGAYGHFTVALSSPGAGEVTVTAAHAATPQMLPWRSRRRLAALDERIAPGSIGRFVQLIQQRLAALHIYVPQTGVYDQGTGLALDAYHRLLRWGEGDEMLDGRTISFLLDGYGAFRVRYPHNGDHAEGDLTEQLLALVRGRRVYEIFPISSGKPSTPTILGNFQIYSKVPGYLPDGMFYSSFFYSGYAIHGYDPAPDYPASHGCLRLPIADAITVYDWLRIGDWVDTYH